MDSGERYVEFHAMIDELEKLLRTKGKEYSDDDDILANFYKGSEFGVDPIKTLGIYMHKHLESIKSYIRDRKVYSDEPIMGRINDAINYLFLLRCLIKDYSKIEHLKMNKNKNVMTDGELNRIKMIPDTDEGMTDLDWGKETSKKAGPDPDPDEESTNFEDDFYDVSYYDNPGGFT